MERAIHLAEQLLALARSDPQELAVEFGPVDLGAVVAEGVTDAHDLALARGIDLGLEAAPNLVVRGDREALRILVRNLVDNAVRYTPPQGAVQVRCRSTDAGTVIEVIDTGPGIPASDRDRVFDRFYRRAGSQENGTGLGLAIVKSIAEHHGARVALGEVPSGGLHVTVSFSRPIGTS